ncbi:hypothetical protein IE81DRAFT_52179 [Ceraceosorus guamensis]|uniref:Uncharacterized protein n=1 Tax=Ceraceosorus guamensis TaxID=1522189 RepID=A0A316W778_9BASI|nr:hypothetical protein IE81DRAFT_52179 [Ceraceosorus guamensis]PWN43913.1 hypothetical protein IE81DRAFT_52179 [Ceraceosorus guamensis]
MLSPLQVGEGRMEKVALVTVAAALLASSARAQQRLLRHQPCLQSGTASDGSIHLDARSRLRLVHKIVWSVVWVTDAQRNHNPRLTEDQTARSLRYLVVVLLYEREECLEARLGLLVCGCCFIGPAFKTSCSFWRRRRSHQQAASDLLGQIAERAGPSSWTPCRS